MSVLRVWDGVQWYPLYMDVFSKCLHKTNNLGDLTDLVAARANLELVGNNVTTHLHDSRYLPLISTESTERLAADTLETNTRTAADTNLQSQIDALKSTVQSLQAQLNTLNDYVTIGDIAPEAPVENKSVWFDTSNKIVKVFHNSAWISLSAVWL